jgi:hypothetical protein
MPNHVLKCRLMENKKENVTNKNESGDDGKANSLLIGEAESKSVSKTENFARDAAMPKSDVENNKTATSHENDAKQNASAKATSCAVQMKTNVASSSLTETRNARGRDVQILRIEEDNAECSNGSGNEKNT